MGTQKSDDHLIVDVTYDAKPMRDSDLHLIMVTYKSGFKIGSAMPMADIKAAAAYAQGQRWKGTGKWIS